MAHVSKDGPGEGKGKGGSWVGGFQALAFIYFFIYLVQPVENTTKMLS